MAGNDGGGRHYQRYLDVLQYWMSPEEMAEIRKEIGDAGDILEHHKRLEKLLDAADRRAWVWLFARHAWWGFVGLMGAILTAKLILPPDWWPW